MKRWVVFASCEIDPPHVMPNGESTNRVSTSISFSDSSGELSARGRAIRDLTEFVEANNHRIVFGSISLRTCFDNGRKLQCLT